MFYDLCVAVTDDAELAVLPAGAAVDSLAQRVAMSFDLGYQVVAVEQVIVGKVPANNPCKMSDQRLEQLQKAVSRKSPMSASKSTNKSSSSVLDMEIDTEDEEGDDRAFKGYFCTPRARNNANSTIGIRSERSILRRLTIVASDPNANIGISGSNSALAPFDIIAVQPTNERMFLLACQSMEVDIISIDLTERLSFQLKHNAIGLAISRGIMFEIKYSPAIVNPTSVRPLLINNALNLVRVTRGKHLILSSGYAAKNGFGGMRPPHDVMNMAALFSLNQTMARPCILDNCRATIFHADTRKSIHKSVVAVVNHPQEQTPQQKPPPQPKQPKQQQQQQPRKQLQAEVSQVPQSSNLHQQNSQENTEKLNTPGKHKLDTKGTGQQDGQSAKRRKGKGK